MSLLSPEALFTQTATEEPFVPGELALSVWVSAWVNTPLAGLTRDSTPEGRKSRRLKMSSWWVAELKLVEVTTNRSKPSMLAAATSHEDRPTRVARGALLALISVAWSP